MGKNIKTSLNQYLNVWYHGSDKPVKKFLYSLIGVNSERITNYHGYGIYFIDNIERAKSYGDIITTVKIDDDADILIDIVTMNQLSKIYNQLKKENVSLNEYQHEFFINPSYGEYSILNDVEEFYFLFQRFGFKTKKDITDFLLRSGIDGMKVTNDINDNILIVFNENIIEIIK